MGSIVVYAHKALSNEMETRMTPRFLVWEPRWMGGDFRDGKYCRSRLGRSTKMCI